jgi:histidine ammonia-lyase
MSNLPAFLVPEPGLNSGFMIAHVTAAALASENKMPCASGERRFIADIGQSGRPCQHGDPWRPTPLDMTDNTAGIVAIEILCAAQGIDLRRPVETSQPLRRVMETLRAKVAFWDIDREMAPDIAAAKELVNSPLFREITPLRVVG